MTTTPSAGLGLLWFLLVLAAIPAVLWLLKRTPYGRAMSGGAAGAAARPVRTIASLSLGPHQRIVTVEVGQGEERRWLVLGVTPQAINALHAMAPQLEADAATAPRHASFAQVLAPLWSRRKGGDEH